MSIYIGMECENCKAKAKFFCRSCSKIKYFCSSHAIHHNKEKSHNINQIDADFLQKSFKKSLVLKIEKCISQIISETQKVISALLKVSKDTITKLKETNQNLIDIQTFKPILFETIKIDILVENSKKLLQDVTPVNIKKNQITTNNNFNTEPCIICEKLGFLSQKGCHHLRCNTCLQLECEICLKHKNPGKNNLSRKNQNKINKKRIDNKSFLHINCSTSDKVNIQVNYNGCQHLRCYSCINLTCKICFPEKCSSCKTKRDDLILHDCDYQICLECISSRCQICNPYELCSNCYERSDGKMLLCEHYVCYNCFIFVEAERFIFHSKELSHCTTHDTCRFIEHKGYILKECSAQEFCFGCKGLINRQSEKKKHKSE